MQRRASTKGRKKGGVAVVGGYMSPRRASSPMGNILGIGVGVSGGGGILDPLAVVSAWEVAWRLVRETVLIDAVRVSLRQVQLSKQTFNVVIVCLILFLCCCLSNIACQNVLTL